MTQADKTVIQALEEVQTRLHFQEKTLLDLNDVIVRQQNEIDGLRTAYKMLHERMSQPAVDAAEGALEENIPPHY